MTITIQDTGSTATTAQQSGQTLITGTPTAGSNDSAAITGSGGFSVTISGTWTGTLAFEESSDGGVTWAAADVFVQGVNVPVQSATKNCIVKGVASGSSQVRVRATAAVTGTATTAFLGNVVQDLAHHITLNTKAAGINIVNTNPTVTVGAYSANNVVGGIQTLTAAVKIPNGRGVLDSVSILDASAQAAQSSIFFFKALPTGGTYADHGALVLAAADLPNFLGKIDILAASFDPLGTAVKGNTLANIGLDVQGDASGNIYAIATTTGTPTYTALCLNFMFGFTQSQG